MSKAILWDIDGVLADDRGAAQEYVALYDQYQYPRTLDVRDNPDWDGYFTQIEELPPFPEVVTTFQAFQMIAEARDWGIFFVTGRPEAYRNETLRWLQKHVTSLAGMAYPLLMRSSPDHSSNANVKAQHFEVIRAQGYEPYIAFDDNDDAAKFYREAGITCLQPMRAVPAQNETFVQVSKAADVPL